MKGLPIPLMLVSMALLLSSATAHAQIYKIVLEDGSVIYTDQPPDHNQDIAPAQLRDIIIQPAVPVARPGIEVQTTSPRPDIPSQPRRLSISSPADETVLHGTGQHVEVVADITPGMTDDMKLQLIFNGEPFGPPQTGFTWQVGPMNPGTQQIFVELLDTAGNNLTRSEIIRVYIIPRIAR